MKPGARLTNPHAAALRRKSRIHEWRSTRADEAARRATARRFGSRHRREVHSETKGMILNLVLGIQLTPAEKEDFMACLRAAL
jgi:hypothetical protein